LQFASIARDEYFQNNLPNMSKILRIIVDENKKILRECRPSPELS